MKTLTINDRPTVRVVIARVQPGVNPRLVVTLHHDGTIVLREHRRRKEYRLDAGTLYVAQVHREAAARRNGRRGAKG